MALIVPVFYAVVGLVTGYAAFPTALLGKMVLLYLLLGGLCFLLSTFTRLDWLFSLFPLLLDSVLHSILVQGVHLSGFWLFIAKILPPFHLVSSPGAVPAGWQLFHVLAYGGGLVAAALAVLLWRPLGVGGRS